jgi:hypothetical protein
MTKDLELAGHGSQTTLRAHMLAQAEEGHHAIFLGQLARVVAGATKYLFAPDLRFKRLEHARQVLVSLRVTMKALGSIYTTRQVPTGTVLHLF